MYYMAFPNDRRAFKCLIYGIYMVDTAQTLILTHDAYNTFAKGFGDLSALDAMQNGWFYAPVLSGIGMSADISTIAFYDELVD